MTVPERLRAALPADRIATDAAALASRRHDTWVLAHLADLQGRPAPPPCCVVRPLSVDEVASAIVACRETRAAIVPFGLGSGVCGGVETSSESVVLDLSQMRRTRFIDEHNLLAAFDAGKRGMDAENEVAERGLTIGHWPQSIELSSVGGWVSTRASGQFSTGYGNIEDLVYSIEAVLADGTVIEAGKAPRAAAGPDLRHLFLGSEGTLGIVTGVTFSLRRAPEDRRFTAFYSPTLGHGIEVQRVILQAGWQPCVMRLYDAVETGRNFAEHARAGEGILLMVHEGPRARVEVETAAVRELCAEHGLDETEGAVVAGWMEHRNQVPSWDSFLERGIILDTIEVSAPWDRIETIYDEVVVTLREVPGLLNASAHSSHAYRSGINLYFTFAARPEKASDMAAVYDECWRRVLETTATRGGGIAHHHGIGRVRAPYLHLDLGEGGVAVLRTLKKALDPEDILNPGNLLPRPSGPSGSPGRGSGRG